MGRTRVLHVITRLVTRGASRHVIDLARTLDPGRFEVEVAAGRGEAYERSIWDDTVAQGIRLHRIEHLQREISPFADLRAFSELCSVIRRGRYDVVHTHISKAGLIGRLATRVVRVPVTVHTYHGIANEIAGSGLKPALLRACERGCASLPDGKVSISQNVADHIGGAGILNSNEIRIIHNGIDLAHFSPTSSPPRPEALSGGRIVGTVGSLTPEKSTADLLRAVAQLPPEMDDLLVCIVGDGALRAELDVEAQRLGIAERVVFAGAVEDVRPWLAAFDLFVLPSRSEGLPGALMEAMALGCPVIVSAVGGVPEVIGDAGVLVEPGDVAEFATQISRLLADRGAAVDLSEAGAVQVQKFSLASMAAKTAALYEELLAVV
ncbi:MAG: glycosyltransferase [Candidatus Latescibacterota bacterium]|nr:glycosyltransferase [Candidatus Latescibacterota bacterium]